MSASHKTTYRYMHIRVAHHSPRFPFCCLSMNSKYNTPHPSLRCAAVVDCGLRIKGFGQELEVMQMRVKGWDLGQPCLLGNMTMTFSELARSHLLMYGFDMAQLNVEYFLHNRFSGHSTISTIDFNSAEEFLFHAVYHFNTYNNATLCNAKRSLAELKEYCSKSIVQRRNMALSSSATLLLSSTAGCPVFKKLAPCDVTDNSPLRHQDGQLPKCAKSATQRYAMHLHGDGEDRRCSCRVVYMYTIDARARGPHQPSRAQWLAP